LTIVSSVVDALRVSFGRRAPRDHDGTLRGCNRTQDRPRFVDPRPAVPADLGSAIAEYLRRRAELERRFAVEVPRLGDKVKAGIRRMHAAPGW
jgi:hypothetical protein